MSDTPRVGIEVFVDATEADGGLARIDAGVQRTGRNLSNFGAAASTAIGRVGDSGQAAAGKVDAATRNMANQLQRVTAAMEAGSRTSREYFEALAAKRGADLNALRPYLDQLDAINARQRNVGISAGQMTAALRSVPAQVTDIVTALQGGQQPLTVLIQQGGQLRDMFGSTGVAARALGSYLVGLVNPFTAVAVAAAVLAVAYNQGSKEADAYNRALVLTGNAAGTTADQMADMARAIGDTVGTQGAAAQVLTALAGTGKVAAANLQEFGLVAVEAQRAIGLSTEEIAKNFADLGKSPLQTTERLNEQYNYLTASVYAQIKALEEQGRKDEAGEVAQKAYADAMSDRSKALVANLGTIERAWKGAGDLAKEAWDKMLNVGRKDTLTEQLANVQEQIRKAQSRQFSYIDGPVAKREIEELRIKESLLQSQQREQTKANEAKVASNKLDEARIEWDKKSVVSLERKALKIKEIDALNSRAAGLRQLGEDPAVVDKKVKEELAAIDKKYSDIYNDGIDSQIAAIKRRGAVEAEVANRSLMLLEERKSAGAITENDYLQSRADFDQASLARQRAALNEELALTEKKQNSLQKQADLRGQIAEIDAQAISRSIQLEMQLETAETRRLRVSADAYADLIELRMKERNTLRAQLEQQQDQNEVIGLSKLAITDLAAAKLEEAAVEKERQAIIKDGMDLTGQESTLLREQAQILRETATAKRAGAAKEAAVDAAKDAEQAWRRTANQIEDSLTDALMRGFESGKSFAENLRDTTINMFKTMVLRPTIQGIVTGSVGGGGVPGAVSAVQTASGLGNLYSAFAGIGGTATGIGNLVGSTYLSAFGTGLAQGANVTEAIAAYQAAAAAGSAGAGTAAAGLSAGSSISTAIAAIPGWGWAAMGAAALIGMSGLFGDGPEKDTRLTFTSNNTPGNISINERGNEGRTGQAYIDGSSAGAFGSFGLSSTFWMDGRQDAVQSFIQTVTKVDDALAGFLTVSERAAVTSGITGQSFTAHTGAEGENPNASGQLDAIFAERLDKIFDSISPGLSALLDGFKGSSQDLANEAAAILKFRQVLDLASTSVFGAQVSLEELAKLKDPAEATSAALSRVANEFQSTSQLVIALGVDVNTAFGAVGLASESARRRMVELAGGVDALAKESQYFAQNFLSKAEQIAPAQKAVIDQLAALGYAGLTTAEQYKAAVQQLVTSGAAATEEGAKSLAGLLDLAPAFKQVADYLAETKGAAEQAAEALKRTNQELAASFAASLTDAVSFAMTQVQRAAGAQRDLLSEEYEAATKQFQTQIDGVTTSVGKLQSLSSTLRTTLSGMAAPGLEAATRAAAQAQLQTSLAIARAGGPLPDADRLKDALSVLSRPDTGLFDSYIDFQRDYLRTANDIGSLAELSDSQLSIEQSTLKALQDQKAAAEVAYQNELARLDDMVNLAQQQVDASNGISANVLSMSMALSNLAAAIKAVATNPISNAPAAAQSAYQQYLGRDATQSEVEYWKNQATAGVDVVSSIQNSNEAKIQALYKDLLGRTGDAAGVDAWEAALAAGQTWEEIRNGFKNSAEYKKLHPFAVGANFIPFDMPAMVHQGERIIPAADNRELMARLDGPAMSTKEVLEELRQLRTTVEKLQVSANRTADATTQQASQFDRLTRGGAVMLTEDA